MHEAPIDWIEVYRAADPVEAELLAGLLRSQAIPAQAQENRSGGGIGELPADAIATAIKVRTRDYDHALAILKTYETRQHEEWICPTCQERQAVSFEVCWQCGTESR